MAEITLARVDSRLIHGQVAVKWTKVAKATKIVVVDDASASNDMMKKLLKIAAPQGMKCLVYSVQRSAEKWKETKYGEGEKVMMVFSDIHSAYGAWKAGLELKSLQLGNVPKKGERKVLFGEVSVDAKEMEELKEMSGAGVEIEIHTIPEVSGVSFEKASKNY